METIFITGGTGYIGRRLIVTLDPSRYRIISLVRKESIGKLDHSAMPITGDLFTEHNWKNEVPEHSIFIHLIGVPHPSPLKASLFDQIDFKSTRIVADLAKTKQAKKFVYLSVAMEPSFIMKDFQMARKKAEDYIIEKKLPYVFIRPWYVLGPGHRWPGMLLPIYKILEWIPATRLKAKAFSLITLDQMIKALHHAIEIPENESKIIEIEEIKAFI